MKMNYFLIVLLSLIGFCNTLSPLLEIVNANNLFAASLYKEIAKEHPSNLLISPYSAQALLAWAHSGCKGETAQELRDGLRLPDNKDQIESGIKESLSVLKGNELYTLRTVNKMYVKEDFSIRQEFKNTSIGIFGADIENINFAQKVEAARTMNEWVEQQTNNKIKNLIDQDLLNDQTITILINAVYFKGNWSNQFSNSSTGKDKFYTTRNDVKEADTMHHYRKYFNYYESSELKAKFLELPFEGGDVSMVIVLPNDIEGLVDLENQVEKIFDTQNFRKELANVALPKFKIESILQMVKTMKNLGIKKLFQQEEADLTGIAGKKGDLVVSDVLQKTYIKVEEGGAEAAAATYLLAPGSSPPFQGPRPVPKEFIADHPFMFYIKAKGFIIFAGKVTDPSKGI